MKKIFTQILFLIWALPSNIISAEDTLALIFTSVQKCIQQCSRELENINIENDTDLTLFNLSDSCPVLKNILNKDGQDIIDSRYYANGISLVQLSLMEDLLKKSIQPQHAINELSKDKLALIIAQTHIKTKEIETSFWDPILKSFADFFESSEKEDWQEIIDWYDSFSIPKWIGVTSMYAAIIFTLGLAVFIIWREIRILGFLSRKKNYSSSQFKHEYIPESKTTLTWQTLDTLPTKQYSVYLLSLVIDTLQKKQFIPDDKSLTNREIYHKININDKTRAIFFNKLAMQLEPVIYGVSTIEKNTLNELKITAEQLFDENQSLKNT